MVIAIIAILATVVIINVTGARAKAQKAKISSNMSMAVKVAMACNSFSGTIKDFSSGGVVCDTNNIADPTEKAAATGKYPVLTNGFSSPDTNISSGITITAPDGETLLATINRVGSWTASTESGGGTTYDITLASQLPAEGSDTNRTNIYVSQFSSSYSLDAVYSENVSSCSVSIVALEGSVMPMGSDCSVSGTKAMGYLSRDARGALDVTINSVVAGKTVAPVLFRINVVED